MSSPRNLILREARFSGPPVAAIQNSAGGGDPRRLALSVFRDRRQRLDGRQAVCPGQLGQPGLHVDLRPV